ncbi:dnaJ homolog subfamily B member 13-like [Macrosteles quadrilineatus]|uniref:dnaJ homolog subfamily B member 13-like n=1 Tax=Macrosteles quadrilineatus TaxID=74068 RepID=UPI0023E1F8B3|nr:dnaJ homolog subfamily B member 13-like [Macrosteles quadrilineatus]
MGLDYYGILELTRNCEDLDIKQAYRRLAINYHQVGKSDEFVLISEAYDVLSEPCRRALYDQYGEEGLKKGVPTSDGFILPYVYHGDALRTFRDFFGTSNPYVDLVQKRFSPEELFAFPLGQGIREKEPPLERSLALTLEEVFHGGVKKMKILRNVFEDDSEQITYPEEKILTIPIRRGLPVGSRFDFPEVGDQGHTIIPADVIFTIVDKPHPVFRRDGLDLLMESTISLTQALVGFTLPVVTIDQRTLQVPVTQVVSPDYIKVVEGEGMPDWQEPLRRGNLLISFKIEFPKYVPKSSKPLIIKALRPSAIVKDKETSHLQPPVFPKGKTLRTDEL